MTAVLHAFEWALALFFAYALVPEVVGHYLGIGVRRRARVPDNMVALTFDDGPGEATEKILELLQGYRARATFFMVGDEAGRRPELAKKVGEAGHEIGNHGLFHRPPWLLGPVATFRQIDDGALTLAAIVGRRPTLHRPPWGQFNAFTMWAARRSGQDVVLWNVNPMDWGRRASAEILAARVVKGAERGNIVLLHDGGGDGRGRTVRALEKALPVLAARGVELVTVSELLDRARPGTSFLADVWNAWEAMFDRLYAVDDLGEEALFRLSRIVYKGPEVALGPDRRLTRGTVFGEIHFKNDRLGKLGAIRGLREFKASMGILARYVETEPKYADVDLFMGTTVLARPAEALGFRSVELPPGIASWWARLYRYWLILVYHPEGGRRLQGAKAQRLDLRLAYITRRDLLDRYGGGAPEGGGKSDD